MNTVEKQIVDVPCDVMADISRIILQSNLTHCITGADAAKNIVRMEIVIPEGKKEAKQNIYDLIDTYNFFRYE
jgi:uncharacterized protein YuzB (UPF0349 family)